MYWVRVCGFSRVFFPFHHLPVVSVPFRTINRRVYRLRIWMSVYTCLWNVFIWFRSIRTHWAYHWIGETIRKADAIERKEMALEKKKNRRENNFQACPNAKSNVCDWRRITRRVTAAAAATGEERRTALFATRSHSTRSCTTHNVFQPYSRYSVIQKSEFRRKQKLVQTNSN